MTNQNLYLTIEKAADNLVDLIGQARAAGENDLERDANALYARVLDLKARAEAPVAKQNRVVRVEVELNAAGEFEIDVTKEFMPEHGGGTQVFHQYGGSNLHLALDMVRKMVTLSPGERVPDGSWYAAPDYTPIPPDHIRLSGGRSVWKDPAKA